MNINYNLLFVFLLVSNFMTAQQIACDGNRFRDTIFSEVKVSEGIKYGEAETISGINQELFIDIYEPEDDLASKRPVILIAFGGSFIEGDRGDVSFLCEAYAKMGYVAVAIDYRLFDGPLFPIPSGTTMQNVVIRAVQDMKAVVRFLKEDSGTDNEYKIDPDYIYVGGISAGSIVACHAAMLDYEEVTDIEIKGIIDDLGGIEGSTNAIVDYDSDVKGLVNFSGGLSTADYVDASDVPFFSVHDENDPIVPYGSGMATIVFAGLVIPIVEMEGSFEMKKQADDVGLENKLITIDDSQGHVSYFLNPSQAAPIIFESAHFVENLTCRNPLNTQDNLIEEITIFPNPSSGLVNIDNTSESSLDYRVYDQIGNLIQKGQTLNSIDISNFEQGIYIIQLRNSDSKLISINKISLMK